MSRFSIGRKCKSKHTFHLLLIFTSFVAGYIAAFDKHWNLALTDVDEHFNRKRSRKSYFSSGQPMRKLLPEDLPKEMKIGSSTLRILKIQEGKALRSQHYLMS